MSEKALPFTREKLDEIIEKFPTPFHIYDEKAIRNYARKFLKAFSWNEGFKEYYAIKAAPNPYLMKILHSEGFGIDCSSLAELVLADKVGMKGGEIMFTSNDTPAEDYRKAAELGAIINLDDIAHIKYIEELIGLPELVCFRYNPGALKEGNTIIGHPEEAKYGFTRDQLFEGYRLLKEKGVKRFGGPGPPAPGASRSQAGCRRGRGGARSARPRCAGRLPLLPAPLEEGPCRSP
jgi:diaminopimelate decarboxylase